MGIVEQIAPAPIVAPSKTQATKRSNIRHPDGPVGLLPGPKAIAFGFIRFRHSRFLGNPGSPRFLQPLPGRGEVASLSTISPNFRPLDSRFLGNDGLFSCGGRFVFQMR